MILSKDSDLQHRNILLASNLIPIPSPTYILKTPNPQFEESEKFTFRIANYMSNNLDKSQRKVIRRLGGKLDHEDDKSWIIDMVEPRTCQ